MDRGDRTIQRGVRLAQGTRRQGRVDRRLLGLCVWGRRAVEQFVTADRAVLHCAGRRPGVPPPSVGSTLVHMAAAHGENEIARFLTVCGADIDARGEHAEGGSPLHAAAAGGHDEMVEILVAAGADVAARDGNSA